MRIVKLLILLSLTSLHFTIFVAAQRPKHPEIKRRESQHPRTNPVNGREMQSGTLKGRVLTRNRQLAKSGPAVVRGFAIKPAPGIDARIGVRKHERLKAKLQGVV